MREPTSRIRIAVVGTGFGARIHVPAFAASGRFDVVALVGRRAAHTAELAARLGVPHALTSLDQALALAGLAAVSVATPPDTHAEYAIAAARAGRHVLCEKPMARSRAEARAMRDAAARAGVVSMIDHEFRFDPSRAMLARLLHRGQLGAVRTASCLAMSPLFVDPYRAAPAWWFDAARGGGWLGASGSHAIDALRVWLGEYAAVAALIDTYVAEGRADGAGDAAVRCDADDAFALLCRMACGAQCTVQQSAVAWGPRLTLVRIAGADATAWIDARGALWCAERGGVPFAVPIDDDLRLPDVEPPAQSGPFSRWEFPAFIRQAEHFADAIEGRPRAAPAAATFDDGVACQEVMDAAREAARTATWVRVGGR
jgi:predicted dehydrogenase